MFHGALGLSVGRLLSLGPTLIGVPAITFTIAHYKRKFARKASRDRHAMVVENL